MERVLTKRRDEQRRQCVLLYMTQNTWTFAQLERELAKLYPCVPPSSVKRAAWRIGNCYLTGKARRRRDSNVSIY